MQRSFELLFESLLPEASDGRLVWNIPVQCPRPDESKWDWKEAKTLRLKKAKYGPGVGHE